MVSKKETGEFVLDTDYAVGFVALKKPEEEHTHGFSELVYTLSGRGRHLVDGKEYYTGRGDLLLINYHSRHAVYPVEDLRYVDIMLKPEYLSEALRGTEDLFLLLQLGEFADLSDRVEREHMLLHFEGEERDRIEFLLHFTDTEQREKRPAHPLMLRSALSILLNTVFRKMAEKQAKPAVNQRLLSYMDNNCAYPLSVSALAAECSYSPAHFSRLFKALTGKSPEAYLTEARLRRAKSLLLTTEKSVEQVCAESGFSDRTAFFKKFTLYTGLSPLQYRKSQK